jgi:hypothetical protein
LGSVSLMITGTTMESSYRPGLSEIQVIYADLPPLDKSREIYLVGTLFREEIGLSPSWNYDLEESRTDYARSVGDAVNTTILGAIAGGGGDSEEIGDIIVHHISAETQHRWLAYTERIEGVGKEEIFIKMLQQEKQITCDLETKATQVRESWEKFLEDYGVPGGEFSAALRAEFVRNKTVWDTAKEAAFLKNVMSAEEPAKEKTAA